MIERPLLALTRRRPATLRPSADSVATDNMRQLIQLRWLAVVGQLVTILFVDLVLGVDLPLDALLSVVATLALVNVLGLFSLRRHRVTNGEMLGALLFDIGALTLQLLLTGGATNPFISLFLVQVVLGAILLRPWSVWLLVAATCLCFAGLTLQPEPLVFPPRLWPALADLYRLGTWIGFGLVCALLVLFITRISRNLRARDAHLAEMRQQTAEEEHIIRMGLFASGAAHELGTPLATLSVILGDWQRMKRISDDPELAGEVAEMQAEVRRCKTIVTDVLHSAGEPRGEALGHAEAGALLDEIVETWRSHPHATAPLDYVSTVPDGARLVADPALRQAVWNLLDNASEASPAGLSVQAAPVSGGLELSICDRGLGFPSEILADFGQPFRSTKGAGRGIGLFLVSNVVRRLGGRLEAANLDAGGAVVRMTLPLAAPPRKQER